METHELELEIAPDGTVRMHVRGAKGAACEKYAEWLTRLLVGEATIERTEEYYEQSAGVDVDLGVRG
jgi:acylphosphatase